MESTVDYRFRGAFLDFHEQGLGRELWVVTTNGSDPIPLLKEYVTTFMSEQEWEDLISYIPIVVINDRQSMPISIGTFISPTQIHIKWSPL